MSTWITLDYGVLHLTWKHPGDLQDFITQGTKGGDRGNFPSLKGFPSQISRNFKQCLEISNSCTFRQFQHRRVAPVSESLKMGQQLPFFRLKVFLHPRFSPSLFVQHMLRHTFHGKAEITASRPHGVCGVERFRHIHFAEKCTYSSSRLFATLKGCPFIRGGEFFKASLFFRKSSRQTRRLWGNLFWGEIFQQSFYQG